MGMVPSVAAFHGRFTPRTEARAFLARVVKRVEAGFLVGRPHFRSRYAVVSSTGDRLAIRSEDFWTDFNVGLNDISLRLAGDGAIEYDVRFGRWLKGCVVMSAAIAVILVGLYLLPLPDPISIPAQLGRGTAAEQKQSIAIFWGMVAWWGVAWPWVMGLFHRGPAERCLRNILSEVDAAPR